jgi:NADPH-dependent curcumin reductase CurA
VIANRRIVLARRPAPHAGTDNFRLEETQLPDLAPGQVLVRNHYLSLDPYMRSRMNDTRSYAAAQRLGDVMIGGTAGEVVESRNPALAVGDKVIGQLGWQLYGISDGSNIRKVDTSDVPLSAYLGVIGMPGVTAWFGLKRIIQPKPGETVAVSAAAGAVGSIVGQLAKLAGCRAIGIAGGEEKCRYVTDTLGFDACVDYKAQNFEAALEDAAPKGIDGYFENVGGAVMNAVLPRMSIFGRIALCGLIAGYDGEPIPITNPSWFVISRLTLRGFLISDHPDVWPAALAELRTLVAKGQLKYRETVAQGLEQAPQAFLSLLRGGNLGKQLVGLT